MNDKRKLLVIDNDAIVREVLVELIHLIRPEWAVTEAEDGKEGLALVAADRPDLVLVDLNMPGMDGDVMIRQLRAERDTADIPFVLLTGEYESSDRMRQIRPHCSSILQKPYTFDQLEALFARLDQDGLVE